ncbi:toll/interleukin-1 receptor domain-containing protein [Amycolatopsis orientalis]|uniref:toll/interleukin-1 receptor domain-containing protein n=1 Tax=Amycolatopsis orientalis TaxID=31958 RepID=UPI000422CD73|nr:TIR domain-containing protein [Amycolatopsis orientalis]
MRVFISYAHDTEGRKVAQALAEALRKRGVDVLWDRDLPEGNPVSLPEWIVTSVTAYPVLCVLSPDYVLRFGAGDGTAARKGVLFESRVLQRRIYDHTESGGCPVIPVADLGFSADLAPVVLKNLVISRFDADTEDGLEQIVRRLLALGPVPPVTRPPVPPPEVGEELALVQDLEAAAPSSAAGPALVHDWLGVVADLSRTDLVRALPAVERIVKAAGDAEAMRRVAECCLRALPDGTLVADDRRTRAWLLLHCQAWYLHRMHQLAAAMSTVDEGIRLAKECGDGWMVAFGKRLLATLHGELAEVSRADARRHHLVQAVDCAKAASAMFHALDPAGDEYGACRTVLACVWFTQYRLDRRRSALKRANKLAGQAVTYLPQDRTREYHELLILRVRISIARGELPRARELVDKALTSLACHADDGASYTELLGSAHLARAELRLKEGGRDAPVNAARDVSLALKFFDEISLPYASATCRWLLASLLPETAGVERGDVRICERLFADPRVRLRGLEERSRRIGECVGGRWTRRSEWKEIARKLRSQV